EVPGEEVRSLCVTGNAGERNQLEAADGGNGVIKRSGPRRRIAGIVRAPDDYRRDFELRQQLRDAGELVAIHGAEEAPQTHPAFAVRPADERNLQQIPEAAGGGDVPRRPRSVRIAIR